MKYKLFLVVAIILSGVFVLFNLMNGDEKQAQDFKTCEDNGGQIIESMPRRCIDAQGASYVES